MKKIYLLLLILPACLFAQENSFQLTFNHQALPVAKLQETGDFYVYILGFEEKPIEHTYVNAGVYVLDPSSLAFLKREERCDMPSLFERLNQKNLRTIVYPVHEDWLDIGRPDDFEQAHRQLKSMRLEE